VAVDRQPQIESRLEVELYDYLSYYEEMSKFNKTVKIKIIVACFIAGKLIDSNSWDSAYERIEKNIYRNKAKYTGTNGSDELEV